jgi:hypothetical protein
MSILKKSLTLINPFFLLETVKIVKMYPKIAPKYKLQNPFKRWLNLVGKKKGILQQFFFSSHLCKISYTPKRKHIHILVQHWSKLELEVPFKFKN